MVGIHITVTATLEHETSRSIGEKYDPVTFSETETIGEFNLISPSRDEDLTNEQLHRLFSEGTYDYRAIEVLLEEHPKLQELVDEVEYDVDELTFDVRDDSEIMVHNEDTVWKAAATADDPLQALLTYTYENDFIQSLSFFSKELLSKRLQELTEATDMDEVDFEI